jgi:hypothetical protein
LKFEVPHLSTLSDQRITEVSHRAKEQDDLLLVMPNAGCQAQVFGHENRLHGIQAGDAIEQHVTEYEPNRHWVLLRVYFPYFTLQP